MTDASHSISKTEQIERRIVRHLVRELKRAGYRPESVWDGGEYVKASSERAVLEAVFAVEDATIHFDAGKGANGRSHGVLIVAGNGWDCVSDWHIGDKEFDSVVQHVCDWIAQQE